MIVDVTPRIHPDHEISLKLSIEVSSVTGTQNIGGINQPVISTKKIEHDVRLKDGEVNILGGLIERTQSKIITACRGSREYSVPEIFRPETDTQNEDKEVLIVVTPHIIRMPDITAENLRSLASGTDTNPEIRLESVVMSPVPSTSAAPANAAPPAAAR